MFHYSGTDYHSDKIDLATISSSAEIMAGRVVGKWNHSGVCMFWGPDASALADQHSIL